MKYIDKNTLVVKIEKCYNECLKRAKITDSYYWNAKADSYRNVLEIINDTLETKEVDLDALGVLAEHLIACDAHLVTPKYTDNELNLLEEWAKNNKAQKL